MGNRWKFLSYRVLIFGSVFLASGGLVFLLMLIYADIEGIEELLVMALVGLLLLVMTLLFITQISLIFISVSLNNFLASSIRIFTRYSLNPVPVSFLKRLLK